MCQLLSVLHLRDYKFKKISITQHFLSDILQFFLVRESALFTSDISVAFLSDISVAFTSDISFAFTSDIQAHYVVCLVKTVAYREILLEKNPHTQVLIEFYRRVELIDIQFYAGLSGARSRGSECR